MLCPSVILERFPTNQSSFVPYYKYEITPMGRQGLVGRPIKCQPAIAAAQELGPPSHRIKAIFRERETHVIVPHAAVRSRGACPRWSDLGPGAGPLR